jgi:hypothetical protein
VAEKVVEMLSSRSELGELRRQCDAYKEKDEKWKRKLQALQKMCQDLVKFFLTFWLTIKTLVISVHTAKHA